MSLARTAPLAILIAVLVVWHPLLSLGLYGWDTYPMIASGSFSTVAEFFGNLGEELMEGEFPGGRYWRPLVHLSFGLDHAFFGLEPLGYRLTDLAILAAGALAVHSLVRRLIESELGALVAGLVYAAHPLHWELLPLPARRADALCVLFTVLALRSMAAPAPPGTPKLEQRALPPWPHVGRWCAPWVALFAALAMASKETGVLAVPLCFALGWMAHTARTSLRVVWPAGVVGLVYAALHTAVLGEVGGGPRSSFGGAFTNALEFAERYGILLTFPVPFELPLVGALEPRWVLLATVAFLAASGAVLWRAAKRAEREGAPPLGAGRAVGLALIWLALVLLMTSAAGVKRSWYGVAFLPAWCLLLGTWTALLDRALARATRASLGAVVPIVACAVALVLGGHLALDIPAEKRASAEAAEDLVRRFAAAVESAELGASITVDARPPEEAAVRHGRSTQRPMTLPPYGLEAYGRLAFPGRGHGWLRCEVIGAGQIEPPEPEELLVLLESRS